MIAFTVEQVWLLVRDTNSPMLRGDVLDTLRWRVLIATPLPVLLDCTRREQPQLIVVDLTGSWGLNRAVSVIRTLRSYRSSIPLAVVAPRHLIACESVVRTAGASAFATYRADGPDCVRGILPLVESILEPAFPKATLDNSRLLM